MKQRMTPILMITAVMVFAMALPALAHGDGNSMMGPNMGNMGYMGNMGRNLDDMGTMGSGMGYGISRHRQFLPIGLLLNNDELAENIGLTKEQRTSLQDQYTNFRKKQIDLRAVVDTARNEMQEAMDAKRFSPETVRAAAEKLSEAREQVFMERVEFEINVRSILTNDQIRALGNINPREYRRHPRGGFRGPGAGRMNN